MGFEPTTPGSTDQCSNQLSYTHHSFYPSNSRATAIVGERVGRVKVAIDAQNARPVYSDWMPNKRLLDKSADRKQEILQAAGRLFSQKGFHATSMRDLAKAVNLQGGSLYAHIESKEDLLFELVSQAAAAFMAQAQSVDAQLKPLLRIQALVRGHLEVMVSELANATVFFHEWKFLDDPFQQQITDLRDAYEAHFRAAIEAGVKSGDFKVKDIRLATLFILSALNGTYLWYKPEGSLSLEGISEHYNALILQTLGYTL